MRTSTCLPPKVLLFSALGLALCVGLVRATHAQDEGVVPASYQSGSFFDRNLGTALRFNYHTRGYGTQDDVFSLGGMKVFNMDDATWFFDGQGTLSNDFGGGFNLGLGYRQLITTGHSFDAQRILGASFWTDGQSTAADNFFSQLGFALESLGDSYDMRLNGSFPLERTQTSAPTLTSVGTPLFLGNNLFNATERVTIDTSLSVVDGEFAKRIMDLEAWAFVGGYHLDGDGVDTDGYRAGVRGYAVPDLALSLQVSDDDLYATNVMFGITWFIGRTNKCNGPCGTLLDRFREPVVRNDFIATTSRQVDRASGDAAIDPDTLLAKNFLFVNSNAGASGDGTFENPFDNLTAAQAALADNDTVFAFSESMFSDTLDLRGDAPLVTPVVNADFLGEGNDILHVCQTTNFGLVTLPESSAGARAGAAPILNLLAGQTGFTAGENSMINNAVINGGTTGVLADMVAAPQLSNLAINTPVDGVVLNGTTGTTVVENTVVITGATGRALVADGGDGGLSLGATINDTTGMSLVVQNKTGGTVDFTGTITDDTDLADMMDNFSSGVLIGGSPMGGNTDTTVNITNTQDIRVAAGANAFEINTNTNTIVNATGMVDLTATGVMGTGLLIDGNRDDSTITFADLNATAGEGDTVSIDDGGLITLSSATATPARVIENTGGGRAFFNSGGTVGDDNNAVITVNSNITNAGGGQAVDIRDRAENDVTIAGTVTVDDIASGGVLVADNEAGNILFTNILTLDTGTSDAVVLTNNENNVAMTEATISFSDLDIDTIGGNGFTATGGGNLIVTSMGTNDINVNGTGNGLTLTGMTIDPANVLFDVVTVTGGGTGIDLQTLDGTGQVIIGGGTNAGDGGVLATTGTAINVDNVDNVAMTNLTVNNAGIAQGVNVTGQQTGSTATFTGLDVTTVNGDAVNVNGNADGAVIFTNLTATTTGTGRGFAATGGGVITMTGTNTIDSTGGTAFEVTNAENLTASNVTIDNTTAQGVVVTGQNTATDSVTLTNFDVTTTTVDAVTVGTNTDGTVNLNTLTAQSSDGDTVVISDNGAGTVNVDGMTATATGAGNAFTATVGGTLSAAGTNNISANTGRGVNIEDMTIAAGGATFADVDVTAGTTNGVNLADNTGGEIIVNGGTMTTTGAAVNVTNSDSVAINGVAINNGTSNGAGILASNGALDSLSLSNVAVESGTSNGVDVTGGTFTATGTNTVTTTTGTGLDVSNAIIGAGGVSFASVDVTGATNGIMLTDLSGGQFRVGAAAATGTDGDGGTLDTTGTSILVSGVTNAVFNDVTTITDDTFNGANVTHTTAAASNILFNNLTHTTSGITGDGVLVTDSGTGELDFTLRNSSVTVAGTAAGFNLITNANPGEIDIRLDNNVIMASDNSAVLTDLSLGTGDVQFLVNGGNDWTNNSLASATANFLVSTDRTLNATIGDQTSTAPFDTNRFTNTNGGGTAFDMEVNSGTATISLDLRDNTASGAVDFVITQSTGAFGVVELTETVTNDARNTGLVDIDAGDVIGDFIDLLGPIKQVD